jgi:hypothetical protein
MTMTEHIDELKRIRAALHRVAVPGTIEYADAVMLAGRIGEVIKGIRGDTAREPVVDVVREWVGHPRPFGVVGRDEREVRRAA